jgi:hypothetical protein
MRLRLILVALGLLVAAVAIAGPPTAAGIWLAPEVNYAFENCPAVGSAMQVIPNGKYFVRIADERVNLVYGTTYDGGASNNRPMPPNIGYLESYSAEDGGTLLACQSAGGTGDVYLTGTH